MARRRDNLPPLSIPMPLAMQQPTMGGHNGMYSPALPTSLQHSFHPPLPMPLPSATMQSFNPGPPRHRGSVQLYPGGPMTPMGGGHFPRPSLGGPPSNNTNHPFPHRNRRQLSIGGPPKAVLGGPARKVSPMPTVAASTSLPITLKKKPNVKLPKETVVSGGENGEETSTTRPEWARVALPHDQVRVHDILPPIISSGIPYPPEEWKQAWPGQLDVFLPGKGAWDAMKHQDIEEKLEKLGVEHGFSQPSGSNVPHIHAPHARAASISTPADPQLLLFKLNKLHQNQLTSLSQATSPQPSQYSMSPSPNNLARQMNHGRAMSLAQPPTSSLSPFAPAFPQPPLQERNLNPFGPNAKLGFDQESPLEVGNKPDFARGFGLDIPEEGEEEGVEEHTVGLRGANDLDEQEQEEEELGGENKENEAIPVIESGLGEEFGRTPRNEIHIIPEEAERQSEDEGREDELEADADALLLAGHSRHHSRLSAALSFRSFGGLVADGLKERGDVEPIQGLSSRQNEGVEGAEEWTGSEDVWYQGGDEDDNESIGEWSNPSDEERARQTRAERRRTKPRRIPDFPRPPETTRILQPRYRAEEDDLVSNPSDEERHRQYLNVYEHNLGRSRSAQELEYVQSGDYYVRPSSNPSPRPLPPLPIASREHSRAGSVHDPAHAHSRKPSATGGLNPFAKPFVFGQPLHSQNNSESTHVSFAPKPLNAAAQEFRPLNAAAQEFTPGGFTFKFPTAVSMPVPDSSMARPLPMPPILPPVDESPFKVQGREKRQRRDSVDEGDSMTSFRYPFGPLETSSPKNKLPEPHPANEFTFAPFSADTSAQEEIIEEGMTAFADYGGNDDTRLHEFTFPPSATKPKRAPIPLDLFNKHPVSSNTVPAGLFKALVNGSEERTRKAVRSRLGSREIFEYHSKRQSLDDDDVQPISLSHKISRQRMVTDPSKASEEDDVFGPPKRLHERRRSSLPDHLSASSMEESSVILPVQNIAARLELNQLEYTIERVLDQRLAAITGQGALNSQTEAKINEVISLFRSQLQESASKSMDDSQMDARNELDFELIRDVVEESHVQLLEVMKREIQGLMPQRASISPSDAPIPAGSSIPQEIEHTMQSYSKATVEAVVEAIGELSTRLETIGYAAPDRERDALVDAMVNAITPIMSASSPDYDYLSEKLAHAVHPHISQFIDLASDKRETATLIVQQLLPVFPALMQAHVPTVDTDSISRQLTNDVRKAIAPIDAFEIKEQVADLVVERLDSRLAVRDKALNPENVANKVVEKLGGNLEPLAGVGAILENVIKGQSALIAQQSELSEAQQKATQLVSSLPSDVLATIQTVEAKIAALISAETIKPDANVLHIKSVVDGLSIAAPETATWQKEITQKINDIPEALAAATTILQDVHADIALSRDAYKRELDEVRKANTDLQVQLAKARGAHGSVRVEKDMLGEKLTILEADRERLRAHVKDLETKTREAAALDARHKELEDSLSKALGRLHDSDVTSQANKKRMDELEEANRELLSNNQTLKSKLDASELQVTFAARDKKQIEESMAKLQKQHDTLAAQQSHWEDIRHTAEQIDSLADLITRADQKEAEELRTLRERTQTLESDKASLSLRLKEQQGKAAASERAIAAVRQNLTSAQQRATEWEDRAEEYQRDAEEARAEVEEAVEARSAAEAELSAMKSSAEEKDAHERMTKDRESKLRDNVAALEAKVAMLQTELQRAVIARKNAEVAQSNGNMSNGHSRSVSRSSVVSTVNGHPSPASTVNGGSPAPRFNGLEASMHAPKSGRYNNNQFTTPVKTAPRVFAAPSGKYPANLSRASHNYVPPSRASVASPTPSAVTVDQEGWWS